MVILEIFELNRLGFGGYFYWLWQEYQVNVLTIVLAKTELVCTLLHFYFAGFFGQNCISRHFNFAVRAKIWIFVAF